MLSPDDLLAILRVVAQRERLAAQVVQQQAEIDRLAGVETNLRENLDRFGEQIDALDAEIATLRAEADACTERHLHAASPIHDVADDTPTTNTP